MTSRLESLVPELLDVVIDYLDSSDLAKLLVCNQHLQQRIEPALYGPKDAYNMAMRWACLNDNIPTILKAISYGASKSTVEMPYTKTCARLQEHNTKSVKMLTIYLAAKGCSANAFRLLLELEAQVDDVDVDPKELKNLMKHLCAARNLDLLRAFLKAGLDLQVGMSHSAEIAWPLLLIIKSGAPLDVVQAFLDRGANPNHVHHPWYHGHLCPLSAAIMANSAPLFNLLITYSANIHGKDVCYSHRKVSHIPVMAAAEAMPKYGTAMMQMCLDSGADINRRTTIFNEGSQCYYYTTPLLVYLDSINTWKGGVGLDPIDGLLYFFRQGASIKSPEEVPKARHLQWLRCRMAPSTIEFLLDKWGLEELSTPKFLSVIKLLIQRGADNPSRILAKYDYHIVGNTKSAMVMNGWQNFLSMLLEDPQVDVSMLLTQLIWDRGEECQRGRVQRGIGNIYRITIDRLIAAGADINAPVMPEGCTVLHKLCNSLIWQKTPSALQLYLRQSYMLLSLLASRGADPTISWNGTTAIGRLTSLAKELGVRHNALVLALASILQGEFGSEF
ncbi:hypothetical protein B7494_g5408 [Chlorociboria aeruginascens]|nr:hypothetical protein B7494_g5408 [Chlorociboria aeruginascens]